MERNAIAANRAELLTANKKLKAKIRDLEAENRKLSEDRARLMDHIHWLQQRVDDLKDIIDIQ